MLLLLPTPVAAAGLVGGAGALRQRRRAAQRVACPRHGGAAPRPAHVAHDTLRLLMIMQHHSSIIAYLPGGKDTAYEGFVNAGDESAAHMEAWPEEKGEGPSMMT